jgi:hypothetical protein
LLFLPFGVLLLPFLTSAAPSAVASSAALSSALASAGPSALASAAALPSAKNK